MIADHVWRPPHGAARPAAQGPVVDLPCDYMNCRRPRDEHGPAPCARCGEVPNDGVCCSAHGKKLCHRCYRRTHFVEVCNEGCESCIREQLPVVLR